ncbi:MAG: sigma 54-interacting transcriptional regulator [Gemmatimonadota bacterium]
MNVTDLYFGTSPSWKNVMARVEAIATTPWPLLILGPRGSGKTLIGRCIHERSRLPGEFVLGPAPSIPESLLQGELLGHARGAFTDAREERKGLLELAHQGTLFLDEIEAASYGLQSLLVGQVEQKELRRVGDLRARPIKVRYLYASNADLTDLVAQGRFRADLLDRIGGTVVRVPALVEYREAVLALAHGLIEDNLAVLGRRLTFDFSLDVCRTLLAHSWPGNLRELGNVSREVAIRMTVSRSVGKEDLPEYLSLAPMTNTSRAERAALREQVAATLRETRGNKSEAARRLDLTRSKFGRLVSRLSRRTPIDGQSRPA